MACLEEKDLSVLADQHINAQKANIQNMRNRLQELKESVVSLDPATDLEAHSRHSEAIKDMEFHLNGNLQRSDVQEEIKKLKVKDNNPERIKKLEDLLKSSNSEFLKDPDIESADSRLQVLESLYKDRKHFEYKDTNYTGTGSGNQRLASIFGVVTIDSLVKADRKDLAERLAVRVLSLLSSSESLKKNPNDFINVENLEVKDSLSDGVEHHHIFNNIYLGSDGKVRPNSVRFFVSKNSKDPKIEMEVIPEYWNSEKHGRNTQFIELMDGIHSGADSATHLHYYKFGNDDLEFIKGKIKEKAQNIIDANTKKLPKLKSELQDLEDRKKDPDKYAKEIQEDIKKYQDESEKNESIKQQYGRTNSAGSMIARAGLTPEEKAVYKQAKDDKDANEAAIIKLQAKLNNHLNVTNASSILAKKELESKRLKDIKKSSLKNHELYGFQTKEDMKIFRDDPNFIKKYNSLDLEIKKLKEIMKDGSIDDLISSKKSEILEAETLSNATESGLLEIFEKSNGFLSFNKGTQESTDYSRTRPGMNAEINKHNIRQALDYINASYNGNLDLAFETFAKNNRQSNLKYSMYDIMNRL